MALDNRLVSRLGQNHQGYGGERIDPDRLLDRLVQLAREKQFRVEWLSCADPGRLLTLSREPKGASKRTYLSTGIHGDEPAGPVAMLDLVERDVWPTDTALYLCPCLNPEGFRANRREHESGLDLNRDYRHQQTAVVQAHAAWISQLPPLDLAVCLHEDWEAKGFYLYELHRDHVLTRAEEIIRRVSSVCPVDDSPAIEGRPAQGGIVRGGIDLLASWANWPEAFFLLEHKTNHTYTLEAPSGYPLSVRVAALCTAVEAALA